MIRCLASARRRRKRKLRRSWGQRAVVLVGAACALGLAGSAAGLAYLYRKVERIPRIELSAALDETGESGGPQNYLIVGIDNDEGIAADDPIRNDRQGQMNTDTIMVVRIDPSSQQASILSLPRDLWVPYPDGSNHRINGAYVRGGQRPDLLIGILNDYLGIPIHHYVEIDFAAFYRLVDAIDGVPVYFPYPARDTHSGLAVLEAGCVTLDREQAIGYVRSRFYEQLIPDEDDPGDADWESDGLSDYGRVQRQQDFIRRALQRAVSKGARNPGTLDRLLDVGLGSVTIDDQLTPGAIFDLARRFRSFDPNALTNYTVPTIDDRVGEAQIVRLIESEAEPILALFRDADAPGEVGADDGEGGDQPSEPAPGTGEEEAVEVAPESVRLTVLNGTGAPGQASETADALAEVGFSVIGRRDAEGEDLGQPRTVVRYPAGSRAQAELVARWLEADAELVELPAVDGSAEDAAASIELITGADWGGIRSEPQPASSITTTSSATTSTTTSAPTVTSSEGSDASSTVPGEDGTGTSTTTTAVLPPC
jgi:LCP family protein required for cell wall assembly